MKSLLTLILVLTVSPVCAPSAAGPRPDTFSAAMNGATEIERHTNAIFVGEPTGSSPNFVGETVQVMLPYSRMRGSISDLYWQFSVALDHRTWIAPLLYAPPSFATYSAGRDPAMEAILAYRKSQ